MTAFAVAMSLLVMGSASSGNSPSIEWEELKVALSREVVGSQVSYRAEFSPALSSRAGSKLVLTGYLLSVPGATGQSVYLLSPEPPKCTQHIHVQPGRFVEIGMSGDLQGLPVLPDQAVSLVGTLEMREDSYSFFMLQDARVIAPAS